MAFFDNQNELGHFRKVSRMFVYQLFQIFYGLTKGRERISVGFCHNSVEWVQLFFNRSDRIGSSPSRFISITPAGPLSITFDKPSAHGRRLLLRRRSHWL